MQNSKLFILLRSLSRSEFREFQDFVSSPVYNKNRNIISLLNAVKKYYPGFDHKDLSNEKIFRKIYRDEKYDYYKLKNLISDLFALSKEYLAFIHFRNSPREKDRHLLPELRGRNLDRIFEQTFKKCENKLLSDPVLDEKHFLRRLELTEENLFYNIPKNPDSRFDFFQDELDFFLNYSLIRILKFYNILEIEKEQNNCDLILRMYDEVMNYVRNKEDEDNPVLLVYYHCILLLKERDEKYFFRLKEIKKNRYDNLDEETRYTLFMHLHNFCAYNFNVKGNLDFAKEQFLLLNENYERKTIFLGKVLYPDFLNHIKIAVRVNEFEWAENFIKEFSHLLSEEKESTLNFCFGYIKYKRGDLDEALDLFSRCNFPMFILKVQVKLLLLQISYEKGFYEQVFSMIDAFRHYLSKENSILEDSKESCYGFMRVLYEFTRVRTGLNTELNVLRIKENIDNLKSNQFGIKLWLNEKLNEFR